MLKSEFEGYKKKFSFLYFCKTLKTKWKNGTYFLKIKEMYPDIEICRQLHLENVFCENIKNYKIAFISDKV